MRITLLAAVAIVVAAAEARAAVYVAGVHGIYGRPEDLDVVASKFASWNSAYVTVELDLYHDFWTGMGNSSSHSFSWHGPAGYCAGASAKSAYTYDAAQLCEGRTQSDGLCKFHIYDSGSNGYLHMRDNSPYCAPDSCWTGSNYRHMGMHLAWFLSDHYSSYGHRFNVVADSMGGVVTRAALSYACTTSYPCAFTGYIDNWITFDSPHEGVEWKDDYQWPQEYDLWQGSSFISRLKSSSGGWAGDGTRIFNAFSSNDAYWWNDDDDLMTTIFGLGLWVRDIRVYSQYGRYSYYWGVDKKIGYGMGSDTPDWKHGEAVKNSRLWIDSTNYSCDVQIQRDAGAWSHYSSNSSACPVRMAWHAIYQGTTY